MPSGVMGRWNDKGFGFIKPDDGSEDLFCHANGLLDGEGSVREGDEVTYQVEFDDRKGKDHAVECRAVGGGGGRRGGGGGRDRSRSRGGGGRGRSRSRGRGGGGGGGGGRGGAKEGPGTGELLRWNADKGFGFIKPDKGDEDLFCHVSALLDGDGSVRDGDRVRFVVEYDDRKGKLRALQVEVDGGGGGKRGGGGGRGRDSRSPPPRRGDSGRRR